MAKTYVSFDKRSGRILSVHHGAADANEARRGVPNPQYHGHQQYAEISDEYVAVITVPAAAFEYGKKYKVDVSRQALVATEGKDGVGFGFGQNAPTRETPKSS